MRVVLDTNVLASAFVTNGLCQSILEHSLQSHLILSCEFIMAELDRFLRSRVEMTASMAAETIAVLREQLTMVEPVAVAPQAFSDPDDLPILGTALAAQAEVLVTGDRDLLALGSFQGVAILSPRDFYAKYR